jgi:hypothetical protein
MQRVQGFLVIYSRLINKRSIAIKTKKTRGKFNWPPLYYVNHLAHNDRCEGEKKNRQNKTTLIVCPIIREKNRKKRY